MQEPHPPADLALKRTLVFGAIFIVIGLCFSLHGGINLVEIYNRPRPMFEFKAVFTPEKGRMWSELLAGVSVCLIGILMMIKSRMDLNDKTRQE